MINRILFAILIYIFQVFGAFAYEKKGVCYWEVEKNGKRSYILGTMHVLSGDYVKELKPKLKKCKYLLVEVDNFKGVERETMKRAVYKDGTTLEQHISLETYKNTVEFFKTFGLPENVIRKYKPWYLGLLAQEMQYSKVFNFSSLPMDLYIMRIARVYKVKIIPFESIQDQIGFFDNLPYDLQEAMLADSIKEDFFYEMQEMKDAYIRGDIDMIEKMLEKEINNKDKRVREFFKIFLVKRNDKMNMMALKYLEKGNVFVAVGLGHIITKNGMVNFLKSRGFKVYYHYLKPIYGGVNGKSGTKCAKRGFNQQ